MLRLSVRDPAPSGKTESPPAPRPRSAMLELVLPMLVLGAIVVFVLAMPSLAEFLVR